MALSRVPGDDELYIGGIFTLRRRDALKQTGITHIVSVLRFNFQEFDDWENYKQCQVSVDDVDDENLLSEFERTNSFISSALKEGGRVLVHCAMGKSRSVTVATAYLLSSRPSLNIDSALALIRETRPMAEPNDGFMQQLELFDRMGRPADVDSHPAYQRWLYQREVELSVATGRAPDTIRFEDEVAQEDPPPGTAGTSHSTTELRCRKCRRTLATEQYFVAHDPRSKKASTASHLIQQQDYSPISSFRQTAPASIEPPTCSHHFIHPLSWMRPTLSQSELSGRLECPNSKCGALVGKYAWQGLRCSCGQWIVPAFSLQAGRVDVAQKRTTGGGGAGAGSSGLRMPPGQRAGTASMDHGIRMPPGMRRGDAGGGGAGSEKGNL